MNPDRGVQDHTIPKCPTQGRSPNHAPTLVIGTSLKTTLSGPTESPEPTQAPRSQSAKEKP